MARSLLCDVSPGCGVGVGAVILTTRKDHLTVLLGNRLKDNTIRAISSCHGLRMGMSGQFARTTLGLVFSIYAGDA